MDSSQGRATDGVLAAAPLLAATRGVATAGLGLGAGHLVAGLTRPDTSPLLVVGSVLVDGAPAPVKEWAIRELGTADKPVLVASVLVVVLALAAALGVVAVRRRGVAVAGLLGLAAVAAGLALLRPGADAGDVVPALVTGATAVAALTLSGGHPTATDPAEDDLPTRRGVVVATGVLGVTALGLAAAGQWLTVVRTRATSVVLPRPTEPADAFPRGLEDRVPGVTPLRTATDDFYRVDTRLVLPTVDVDTWSLTIDGDVEREVTLSFDDLLAMPMVERDITLTCVSNEVGGPYAGGARWLGVPLRDVLDLAGIAATGADQILSTDVDGMTISTPLAVALDGRDSLVAVGMNGRALPRAHGFPALMVVPGLYGYVGACKWLRRMTLTTYDAQQAYWTERDWATDGPIKVASRVDTPRPLSESAPGRVVVAGVAWAQGVGIAGVEVRIDGGAWRPARLGPEVGDDYWRQWSLEWDAAPGRHLIACRATDKSGRVQTAVRARPFPDGATGWHEIAVTVT